MIDCPALDSERVYATSWAAGIEVDYKEAIRVGLNIASFAV